MEKVLYTRRLGEVTIDEVLVPSTNDNLQRKQSFNESAKQKKSKTISREDNKEIIS